MNILTVHRETLTQYITFKRGGGERGVCTLVLRSLATVLTCKDPSVRIVQNPRRWDLYLYSTSLWIQKEAAQTRVADPDWIRIKSGQWIRIRNPDSESGSGSRRAKMTHKSRFFFTSSCFEVLDGLFWELKASSVTWTFYGDLGTDK
jgi:hypothetical protein